MTDGKIMQKQATCHGYKMMELSNRDVMVIDPHGKPIARTMANTRFIIRFLLYGSV